MAEKSSSRASVENLLNEEATDITPKHQNRLRKYHGTSSDTKKLTLMLAVSLLLNFSIVLLLAVSLFLHSSPENSIAPENILQWTSFAEDLDFQSLDSKFDAELIKGSGVTEGIIQDTDGRLPRQISWSLSEPVGWWKYHIDHCIEHIRMSMMCQADTTPRRFVLDGDGKYSLPTRRQFQCVDFNAVWAWAEKGNKTGDVPGLVEGFEKRGEKVLNQF